jgi:hypothetical protein
MKLTVEMFGLSPFTDTNAVEVEVEVEVEDGAEASLDQVIAALGRKLPALRGRGHRPRTRPAGGKLRSVREQPVRVRRRPGTRETN